MISSRKFAYAALLAAVTLNIAPTLASAQEPARGKFTLTHDVYFGNAKVPAGEYEFSFNAGGVSPVLVLSKLNGARSGYLVLVPAVETSHLASISKLELKGAGETSYVSSMDLPEFGMNLLFSAPSHAIEKQVAKTGLVASAGQ